MNSIKIAEIATYLVNIFHIPEGKQFLYIVATIIAIILATFLRKKLHSKGKIIKITLMIIALISTIVSSIVSTSLLHECSNDPISSIGKTVVPLPFPGLREKNFDMYLRGGPYYSPNCSQMSRLALKPENIIGTWFTILIHMASTELVLVILVSLIPTGCTNAIVRLLQYLIRR